MKLIIYIEAAVHYERLRKVLSPHFNQEFVHIDEAHSTKLRLVPHAKECSLALVDCDGNSEGALNFTRLLRQLATNTNTVGACPIIALSSASDVAFLKQMMEAGCTDFMLKPYEDINLINRLQKCLKNQLVVDPGGYLKGDSPQAHAQDQDQAHAQTQTSTSNTSLEMFSEELLLPQMVPLAWHSDFEIGVEAVDEDHKKIIERYRQLYLSMRDGGGHGDYEAHVQFLMDYVKEHFAREEALQEAHGYVDFTQHQRMHRAFTQRVEALIEDYHGRQVGHSDLIRLNLFIKDWLLRHILVEDRKIGQHILKQKNQE